jgi:Tfp pilus assembly protein PilO
VTGEEYTHAGYLQQWTAPPTVIAVVVAVTTLYGGWVVQQERLDALRMRIEVVEREYQRRDVLAEQLRSMNERLYSIEQKLGDRSPLVR